jgi:hypothetical protein
MSAFFKTNTLLSTVLAVTFYLFFMFAKHDPVLSVIVPFSNDPYDAVGSFAVITSVILVIIALVRAFRPYRNPATDEQKVFLIRTQMAIALAVMITVVTDLIAMLRHLSTWLGTPQAVELIVLLSGITIYAIAVGYLAQRSGRGINLPVRNRWKSAFAVSLIAIFILTVYPENLIQDMYGHLFTILAGMLLLFVPMSALDIALVPFDTETMITRHAHARRVYKWIIVLLLGLGIGLIVFLGETSEGGGRGAPLARVAVVFAVFVGAGALAILIGYAFLRKPLGLFR